MSDTAKLRKLSRQMKLLGHLQNANRGDLAGHLEELAWLQEKAAELDRAGLSALGVSFLDVRLAFRTSLEPKLRGALQSVAVESARAAVLKRRTGAVAKDVAIVEARIEDAAALEQLQDMAGRNPNMAAPALRKSKRQ